MKYDLDITDCLVTPQLIFNSYKMNSMDNDLWVSWSQPDEEISTGIASACSLRLELKRFKYRNVRIYFEWAVSKWVIPSLLRMIHQFEFTSKYIHRHIDWRKLIQLVETRLVEEYV